MLTFLQSRKRSDSSLVRFVLQVRAKKPTQCFDVQFFYFTPFLQVFSKNQFGILMMTN